MKKNDKAAPQAVEKIVTRLRLDEALGIGVALHRDGMLDEAADMYNRILARAPGQPDALHFLGVLRHQTGDSNEAIRLIRETLDQVPEHVDAWNNLGNVYKESGQEQKARSAYEKVLSLAAKHPDANCNVAVMLRASGQTEKALEHLERALAAAPEHVDAYYNLSLVLQDLGEFDKAADAAQKALELGRRSEAYESVATSLRKAGRLSEAIAVVKKWLRREPDNPVAQHLLAAYVSDTTPDRASDAYVVRTFDEFAPSFDAILEKIEYRAPELVRDALAAALPADCVLGHVIDAGCGTGLCGPLLRSRTDRLSGVDLSGPMLAKARDRGCYDALVKAELTAYLEAQDTAADAIISADTLVYFGRLEDAMRAAHGALKPGGLLVYTVEALDDGVADPAVDGFSLQLTGRYAHARGYVERCLHDAGFNVVAITDAVLRKEMGTPVDGLVVSAVRPAS